MGRKIFVTYKYGDTQVRPINGQWATRVRHYVDAFQDLLDSEDHVNKGEADGEDLSHFKDNTIASKLRDKIYDSSITVVFISKGMKESTPEEDQWIPWEVAYSLREQSRNGRVSRTNAVLAVALPDECGSYEYFIVDETCPLCHSRLLKTGTLFRILKENMFNKKDKQSTGCSNHGWGGASYTGLHSYIHVVKWDDAMGDINRQLEIAVQINADIASYEITKKV